MLHSKENVVDILRTTNHVKVSYTYSLNPFLYHPFGSTVFIYDCEFIFLLPTTNTIRRNSRKTCQCLHDHCIIVHMFQISTVLFEQDQQICIIAYKMLRYVFSISSRSDIDKSNWRPRVDPKYSLITSCWSHATSSKISLLLTTPPYPI